MCVCSHRSVIWFIRTTECEDNLRGYLSECKSGKHLSVCVCVYVLSSDTNMTLADHTLFGVPPVGGVDSGITLVLKSTCTTCI